MGRRRMVAENPSVINFLATLGTYTLRLIGQTTMAATMPVIIPTGLIAFAAVKFYEMYGRNPFRMNLEDMRSETIDVTRLYEDVVEELEHVEKLLEKAKAEGRRSPTLASLEMRRRELEQRASMILSKKLALELIINVRERIELYKELYKGYWDKMSREGEKLLEDLKKQVEKAGMREDFTTIARELIAGIDDVMPPTGRMEVRLEEAIPAQPQATITQQLTTVEEKPKEKLEITPDMLKDYEVQEWLDLIDKTIEEGATLKVRPGTRLEKFTGERGYRNLLIALLTTNRRRTELEKTLEDKPLKKAAVFLKKLSYGEEIQVDPQSSDKQDYDDILQTLHATGEKQVERGENTITTTYTINTPKGTIKIQKQIKLNEAGYAETVKYKKQ
ncbi:MAG: hypothetical protein GSR85_00710 [Desulfurococcales archaeon]|nr:hypothetical protein [Desulfurococcales archaeon]